MFFKQTLQNKTLKQIDTKRDVRFLSFSEVRKAGFIFSVNEPEIDKTISLLINFFKENNIANKGIGIKLKKLNTPFVEPAGSIKIISKWNVNYYGLPDKSVTDQFINEDFDLLIDLNLDPSFTSKYILLNSKPKFLIGRTNQSDLPYDMVIENAEQSNSMEFINQVIHYISSIRPA